MGQLLKVKGEAQGIHLTVKITALVQERTMEEDLVPLI